MSNDMTVNEMISKYDIVYFNDTTVAVGKRYALEKDNATEELMRRKPEIIAELKAREEEKKRERDIRAAKIAAIEGLEEVENALMEYSIYRSEYAEWIENDAEGVPPVKPATDIDAIRAKYPRATAYIHAKEWKHSENWKKFSEAQTAMEKIENGEDAKAAIDEMEKNFKAYCTEHMWD